MKSALLLSRRAIRPVRTLATPRSRAISALIWLSFSAASAGIYNSLT